jgi:DNA processing protein
MTSDLLWSAIFNQLDVFSIVKLSNAKKNQINLNTDLSTIQRILREVQIEKVISSKDWMMLIKNLEWDFSKERKFLFPGSSDYPSLFYQLEEPPMLLRIEGGAPWLDSVGLAVVGSREPQEKSIHWMNKELKDFLKISSCFTASGGARGIDQRAHVISLQLGIPTVAFLPSGLDQIYPESLNKFKDMIMETGGAIVSEYASDQSMRKHYFSQRNRLISGLCVATLVIESRIKSGTMITAKECIEQGRSLWVLPGHPTDMTMSGNLQLLMEGATPIGSAQDLGCLFAAEALHQKKISLRTHVSSDELNLN